MPPYIKDEDHNPLSREPSQLDIEIGQRSGSMDIYGQSLDRSLDVGHTIDRRDAEKLGYVDDKEGFIKSGLQAVNRTSREVVKGVAKTIGADRVASSIETDLSLRKDLDPVSWSESRMGWIGDSLGMGLTESAGLIAAGAVTASAGAPAAVAVGVGMAGTYVRLYGENRETLESMNTMGLSEGELTAATSILTLFQSAIEIGTPAEIGAGRALSSVFNKSVKENAKIQSQRALGRHLKTKEGKKLLARMASEYYKPTTAFGSFVKGGVKGAIGEYGEEVGQELSAIMAEEIVSGELPTSEQYIDRVLIQPLRALPAGLLMGGASAMNHSAKAGDDAVSDIKPVTEEAVAETHFVVDPETGQPMLDEKSLEEENNAFNALTEQVVDVKNVSNEEAVEVVELLKQVAYSLSRRTREAGVEFKKPVAFVESISTIAMDDSLSQQDIMAIRDIQESEEIPNDQKGKRMMGYIAARYGNKHSFYKLFKQVNQSSQKLALSKLTDEMEAKMVRSGAVPMDDTGRKSFSKTVKTALLGIKNGAAKNNLSNGRSYLFSIKNIGDDIFGMEQISQLYAYGTTFEHEGTTFRVTIQDDGILVAPASEADADGDAIKAQTVIEERRASERVSQALPIEETTQSDDDLTIARAIYAQMANKALGMESFLEYWKNRKTATPSPSINYGELADTVFQSVDDTMTGTEIITLARADAATEGRTLDDITARSNQMHMLGDAASKLYEQEFTAEAQRLDPAEAVAPATAAEETAKPAVFDERALYPEIYEAELAEKDARTKQEKKKAAEHTKAVRRQVKMLERRRKSRPLMRKIESLTGKITARMEETGVAYDSRFNAAAKGTLGQLEAGLAELDIVSMKKTAAVLDKLIDSHVARLEGLAEEARAKNEPIIKAIDSMTEEQVKRLASFEATANIAQMIEDWKAGAYTRALAGQERTAPDVDFRTDDINAEIAGIEAEEARIEEERVVEEARVAEELKAEEQRLRGLELEDQERTRRMEKFSTRVETDKALTKRQRDKKNADLRKAKIKARDRGKPLLQQQESDDTIGGMYDPQSRTAIFFGNADAGTVIHELIHHMSAVLPNEVKVDIQLGLASQTRVQEEIDIGKAAGRFNFGVATEEAFADSINQYIINNVLPEGTTENTRSAYETLKQAMGVFTQKLLTDNGFVLAPTTKEFFDTFLADVSTEEIHGTIAGDAMAGVQSEGISKNQAMEAEAEGEVIAPLMQGRVISVSKMSESERQAQAKEFGIMYKGEQEQFEAPPTVMYNDLIYDADGNATDGGSFSIEGDETLVQALRRHRNAMKAAKQKRQLGGPLLQGKIVDEFSSEEELRSEATRLGISFDGYQETGTEIRFPYFTDPETKATFSLDDGETVKGALNRVRKNFGLAPLLQSTRKSQALTSSETLGVARALGSFRLIEATDEEVMDVPISGFLGSFNSEQAAWYKDNQASLDRAFTMFSEERLNNLPDTEGGIEGVLEAVLRMDQTPDQMPLFQGRQRASAPRGATESKENVERMRKNILSHLHGAIDTEEGVSAHEALTETAYTMFAEEFEGKTLTTFSLSDLSYTQVKLLQKRIEPRKAGKVISEKSSDILDSIISEGESRPTADHPDKFYDRKRDQFSANIMKVVRKAIDLNNSKFINLATYLRQLDGFIFGGAFEEKILKPIAESRSNAIRIQEKMHKEFAAIKKRNGVGLGVLSATQNIEIGGLRFSESQLVLMAMAGRKIKVDGVLQVSHAQHAISESNAIPMETFDMAVKYVAENQDLASHAQFLVESYQYLHDQVSPMYLKMAKKQLPSIENYFPLIRKDGTWSDKDAISTLLEAVAPAGRNLQSGEAIKRSFKGRTQRKGSVIRLDDADNSLTAYAESAANYMAKAEIIREVSDAISTSEFKDHMRRVYGNGRGDTMTSLLTKLVSRELFANAKTTGMDDAQMLARHARNKFTFAMLGGRLMTMPKQAVSVLNFMARLTGAMSPRFMTTIVANSFTISQAMISNANVNAQRIKDGSYKTEGYVHLLEGHDLHDMLKDYAPMLYDRHGNPETADFSRDNFRGLLGKEVWGIKLGELAMGGIKMFDMLAVGTAWMTGFDHIVAEELAKGTDSEQARVIAAETVNQMISDSQPPSVAHERTLGQTDDEIFRGFLPFSAQTMLNWQEWTNGILAPSINLIKKGDMKGLFKAQGYNAPIAQRLAIGFMAPAIALGVLSRRRWPKDKEEMVADMFFYPLSMMPAIGSPFAHGLQSGWRKVDLAPVYLQVTGDMMTAAIDVANYIVRDGEIGEKEVENFTQATSVLLSVPTAYTHFLHVMYDRNMRQAGHKFTYEDFKEAMGAGTRD